MKKISFVLFSLCMLFLVFGVQAQKATKTTKITKATQWKPGTSILINPQTGQGEDIMPAGIIELVYTKDGNLILYAYYTEKMTVWSAVDQDEKNVSKTLKFQSDGNLVMYRADGSVAWASNCHGQGGSGMELLATPGEDQLIITKKDGTSIWGTPVPSKE